MPSHITGTGPDNEPPSHKVAMSVSLDRAFTLISDIFIKVGILCLLAPLVYILYCLIVSPGAYYGGLQPSDRLRLLSYFSTAARFIVWSVVLLAFGIAYQFFFEEVTGYILAIFGALFYWGTPYAAGWVVPSGGGDLLKLLIDMGHRAGVICLLPGAVVIAFDVQLRIRQAWTGKRKDKTVAVPKEDDYHPGKGKLPFRCWETSFCRPYVRDLCPRYIEKVPCWRRKEGCFCEEKIVIHAMQARSDGNKFYSQMRQNLGDGRVGRMLTPKDKRERCRKCPIYAEHQRLKYKLMMPFAFPATFLLLWGNLGRIREFLDYSVAKADNLAAALSFHSGPAAKTISPVSEALTKSVSSNVIFFGVMAFLTIILLTWLLRFIEYLVFKLQV